MLMKSIMAAGVGAISPALVSLSIGLHEGDPLPDVSYVVGLVIFAALGSIVGWIFEERDLKKAFYVGVGLPAMIQLSLAEVGPRQHASAEAPDSGYETSLGSRFEGDEARTLVGYDLMANRDGRLQLNFGTPIPAGVHVEFLDRRGHRQGDLQEPAEKRGRVLEFAIPRGAASFRVVVGNSHGTPVGLTSGGQETLLFEVSVTRKRWSGLKQALGVRRISQYEILVRLGSSVLEGVHQEVQA